MDDNNKKHFHTTCVNHGNGDDINAMTDKARQITFATFKKNVDAKDLRRVSRDLGYLPGERLQLHTDWSVSFYKSTFCGKPCYYFVWSAIEHIFI